MKNQTRDCGERLCAFGQCSPYPSEETMCCPDSNACPWYDFSCNLDVLKDYFHDVSEVLKDEWNKLAQGVQDKLTTSDKFKTLSDMELDGLATSLLSQLKSIGGMTARQLGVVKNKVNGMSTAQISAFFDNLNPEAITDGMASLALGLNWTESQVSAVVTHLKSETTWGIASNWTTAQISSLGPMMAGLDLDSIRSFADSALVGASSLVNLSATQLSGLASKVSGMSPAQIADFFENLNPEAIAEGMASFSLGAAWTESQVSAIVTKLKSDNRWGIAENWTTSQINSLGPMISGLDLDSIQSFADSALARASSLVNLSSTQLSGLASKVSGMSPELISDFFENLNAEALKDGLAALSSGAVWTERQVAVIVAKLESDARWGMAPKWATSQISSLGPMITEMDLDGIRSFADAALAKASSLVHLSSTQLSGLTHKVGNMSALYFISTIAGVDAKQLHAAMLSQCEIQCDSDAQMAFLTNPTSANAAQEMIEYVERVRSKSSGAALAYSNAFCSGDPGNIDEALAELESASMACTGSNAKSNVLRDSFERWSDNQGRQLVERMTNTDALGPLTTWGEPQMSSLCNQYASISPSGIAKITGKAIVTSVAGIAIGGAVSAAFGPVAPVALWALSKSADKIAPATRAAWTEKIQEGLGVVSKWTCSQVASLRTLASGLNASDLAALPADALKGLLPKAVTAMQSVQVQGFTPEGLGAMTDKVRARISGEHLEMLDTAQRIAAVCKLTDVTYGVGCPEAVIDVGMSFDASQVPVASQVIGHFRDKFEVGDGMTVEVLSVLPDSERPLMYTGRRLEEGTVEMMVRINSPDQKNKESATATTQSAAMELAQSHGGSVSYNATGFDVMPPETQGQMAKATMASKASALQIWCTLPFWMLLCSQAIV